MGTLDRVNVDEVCALIRHMDAASVRRVNVECVERIKYLRKVQTRQIAATLEPGDRVTIVRGIKPQYMIGVRGRIKRVLQTKVEVEFDPGQYLGRFAGSTSVRVPISCLRKED